MKGLVSVKIDLLFGEPMDFYLCLPMTRSSNSLGYWIIESKHCGMMYADTFCGEADLTAWDS